MTDSSISSCPPSAHFWISCYASVAAEDGAITVSCLHLDGYSKVSHSSSVTSSIEGCLRAARLFALVALSSGAETVQIVVAD